MGTGVGVCESNDVGVGVGVYITFGFIDISVPTGIIFGLIGLNSSGWSEVIVASNSSAVPLPNIISVPMAKISVVFGANVFELTATSCVM